MSRIELALEISEDFDRILEHLYQYEVTDAPSRVEEILQGISVLEHNPLIGRSIRADMRELIIGRQSIPRICCFVPPRSRNRYRIRARDTGSPEGWLQEALDGVLFG